MPRFCAVVGCSNRSNRETEKKYFGFPGVRDRRGRDVPEGIKRRELWVKALRRADMTPQKIRFASVCSDHFLSGYPAASGNLINPDYVPTQKLGYGSSVTPTSGAPSSHSRATKRLLAEGSENVYKQKRLKEDPVPSLRNFNEITRQRLPLSKACSSQNVELLIIPEVGASRPGNFPCSDPLALEDVVAPLNAVNQEQIFQQGNEVLLDFFTALHTGKLRANIPNSSWGFHIQNKPVKYIMFSQSVEISNDFDAPHITKKVVIYESCEVKVWLLDKKVDIKDFSRKLNFVGDLERLLATVNEAIICEGGPSISCYSNVRVRCCYKDNISKKWRHMSCSVYLEKGLIKCFNCASLENILRKHTIQNRRKHHVILPPVAKKSHLVKKKAVYKQSRMLKRSLIRLQQLQDEVNGLKQKLTDVKLEVVEEILKDSNMPENQVAIVTGQMNVVNTEASNTQANPVPVALVVELRKVKEESFVNVEVLP